MSETYVVILQHGDLSGIQKIWGPYPDRPAAGAAQVELAEWPLYGLWSVEPVCAFPVAAQVSSDGRQAMLRELRAQAEFMEGSPDVQH